MKQQYLRLFAFLFGITFIVSGVIFTFVNSYKEDKKEKEKIDGQIADEIGDVYSTFFKKEKELSDFRDELIEEIMEYITFYTEMPAGYEKIISQIEQYENYIKEIEDISSYLKEKCNSKYSVKDANEKCNSYYINLEKTINTFIGDLDFFNSKIDEYNEWTKEENNSVLATVKYKTLEKYEAEKYTEYVDLNKDGTYLGMNVD